MTGADWAWLGALAASGAIIAAIVTVRAWRRGPVHVPEEELPPPPALTPPGCGFCDDLTVIGEPEDCECPVPCGRAWCTAAKLEAQR